MSKKTLLTVLLLVGLPLSFVYADSTKEEEPIEKKWTVKGITGVNLSQTSLVNWSAGGENTIATNVYLNVAANYVKGKLSWDNDLSTEYGTTYTSSNKWVKSVDKLAIATKLGYKMSGKWYLSGLADFRTQYDKGYKDNKKEQYISKLLAPAYTNIAIGADYKPNKNLSVFMSPVTGKMTIVRDDYLSSIGAFGVKEGKKFRGEFGAYVKGDLSYEIMKNVTLLSKASLFTAYDKSFGNVDIIWENIISMKVNKLLTATINTNLQYDNDVKILDENGQGGAKVQFKELIGVGIAYKF